MFGRSPIAQKAVKSVSEKTIEQAIRATIQCPEFPPVATALFTPVGFATRRSPPRSRTPSPVPQAAKVSSAPPSLAASPSASYLEIAGAMAITPRDVPLAQVESFEAPLPMQSFALDEPEMMQVTLGQNADEFSSAQMKSTVTCLLLPEPEAATSSFAPVVAESMTEVVAMECTATAPASIALEVELPTLPSSMRFDHSAPFSVTGAEYAPTSPAQLPLLDARVVEAILETATKELPAAIDTIPRMTGEAPPVATAVVQADTAPVVFRNIF